MRTYYDTGVILKLYTLEPDSKPVRRFVTRCGEPLYLNSLHRSECISAFRLKAFRKECTKIAATRAIADLEDDLSQGVIRLVGLDWDRVWDLCRELSDHHGAVTGCRTLDTLHVACARSLAIREFVTTDKRQTELARRAGMQVVSPLES